LVTGLPLQRERQIGIAGPAAEFERPLIPVVKWRVANDIREVNGWLSWPSLIAAQFASGHGLKFLCGQIVGIDMFGLVTTLFL
jgi:hypothetical protein